MKITGYFINGSKQYIAFTDGTTENGGYKITDGFHDKVVNDRNREKYAGYVAVDKADIDVEKITRRMKGTRPWHPLLRILGKEAA